MSYQPFFIMSLPRSRTAWLSQYLTLGRSQCAHELFSSCIEINDIKKYMNHMSEGYAGYDAVGNSDCANVYFYDELQLLFPRAKYLWLYRSRVQVKMEMQALNLFNPRVDYALMRATDVLLEHGKTDDYNLCINYLDLDSELERIFHFLTNQSTSTMSYSVHRSDLNRLQIQIKHEALSGLNSEKFEKLYGKRDPNVHSEVINRLVAISEPTI